MLNRAVVLALAATVRGWNQCEGPDVDWMALDEGVGKSASYAAAAMNGNMYSAGYTKGNFAFVGVTDGVDVNPVPSATLWGDTTSDAQNLYIAEVNSVGSMTKGWHFKGSAIQQGALGHGEQTNGFDHSGGMHAMVDGAHIVARGGFRQLLTLPDGTVWSSALMSNGDTRQPHGQVPFVVKLDVSKTTGVGAGTTGWAKMMDDGYPGGVSGMSVDGDASGNMIVSFTGCATWDATFVNGNDRYGNPSDPGKGLDCTHHLKKLAAADGAVMWTKAIPHTLESCRAITDGSFYCGWTMKASDGTFDFGNGITVAGVDDTAGIIKYDGAGVAQWAKATATTSFSTLEVSHDGTLLAYYGSPPRSSGMGGSQVSRIDTSAGNEGNVLWTDTDSGVGTHGFRDIAVTHDGREVLAYGQISGGEGDVMTDATGSSMTLRSRGVSDIFVACFDAATGAGKWALDGGGSDTEYFLGGIVADPSTNDIYVAGYTRSEFLHWGDVKRSNVMYEMNSVSSGTQGLGHSSTPVGSNKALVTKIKSTTSLPSCLNSCTAGVGLGIQASDVKSGYCFIDRHCYAEGEASPYADQGCKKCDPTTAAGRTAWSAPVTTSMCFIGDKCIAEGAHGKVPDGTTDRPNMADDPCSKCIPSVSGTAYSPVAEKGCMLNMATFAAACYDDKGAVTMNETAKLQLMADKTTMTATVVARDATISTLQTDKATMTATVVARDATISTLQTDKTSMTTTVATMTTTMATRDATISTLQTDKATMTTTMATRDATISTLQTDKATMTATVVARDATISTLQMDKEKSEDKMPTWAIAIIVVIGAVLLLVVAILGVVVSREQQGKPVFVPKKSVTSGGEKI